jgi:hypothetical protein
MVVGVETGDVVAAAVVVSVAVAAGGMDMLAGATVCAIQADTKRAIATTTNKVFFITELLTIKKTTGGGLLPSPVAYFKNFRVTLRAFRSHQCS